MVAGQKKGLGKGLSALMSDGYSNAVAEDDAETAGALRNLDLSRIVSGKFQPRHRFSEEYLQELAASIRKNGIMQPIVVRPLPRSASAREEEYEIIAGERRWRAAKMAGLSDIPAIIRDIDDKQALELALVENVQRQDLSPLEEGQGYQRLMDEFSYTQEELSATVGKSRSHIANLLRLLSLPDSIKRYLDDDKISMGHARALLNAKEPEAMAEEVIRRGLNVRQTENLCKGGLPAASPRKSGGGGNANRNRPMREKDPDILALEETLSESLGIAVSIEDDGQQGQIIISYSSLSQLDEVLKRLGGGV